MPPRWLLVLLVIAGTAGVFLQYRTILGRTPGIALLVVFLALICVAFGLLFFGGGDLIMNYSTQFRIVFIPEVEIPVRMLLAFMAAVWSMTAVASTSSAV